MGVTATKKKLNLQIKIWFQKRAGWLIDFEIILQEVYELVQNPWESC